VVFALTQIQLMLVPSLTQIQKLFAAIQVQSPTQTS
jgi:hypothetical protein